MKISRSGITIELTEEEIEQLKIEKEKIFFKDVKVSNAETPVTREILNQVVNASQNKGYQTTVKWERTLK